MEFKINFAAVLVAVVVNFIFGFIWYTPLFGKIWGKEMGYDPNIKPDNTTMIRGLSFAAIGNFLFAWVLAWTLVGWQFIPGAEKISPLMNAMNSSFFLWLGFYVPVHLNGVAWEKKSWKIFAIDGGYHFLSLLIAALILTHWK